MAKIISINSLKVGKSYELNNLYELSERSIVNGKYMFIREDDTGVELKSYDRGLTFQVLAIYRKVK